MATISTTKELGSVNVLSSIWRWCLTALKGVALAVGGMGGCLILGTLLLPYVIVISFIIKLILVLPFL